jgi:hypothetical protein
MWDELGIAPTDDPKTIRRAYAARLRQIDPDRDIAAFERLRGALAWALGNVTGADRKAIARPRPARDPAPTDDSPPVAPVVVSQATRREPTTPARQDSPIVTPRKPLTSGYAPARPVPEWLDEPAREQALMIAFEAALRDRNAVEATRLYYRAAANGAFPLGQTEHILARLFAIAADERALDPTAFRELARCAGWEGPPREGAAASDVRRQVLARLTAEDWYDALVARADRKKGTPRPQVKVARLLLERIRRRWLVGIDRLVLKSFLGEYKPHEIWLRDRIDPAWVASLEERIRRREIIAGVLALLFVGGLLLDGIVVVAIAVVRDGFSPGFVVFGLLGAFLAWILKHMLRHLVGLIRRRPT